ncbi:MAG: S26 family signal peptidase [Methanobacteriota archaeon]|nr:MAG: S26 family signal peptidase [Euryarchaeota archaeon]
MVVESDSMMHSEDNTSYVGVIDTGDMVLVKDVDSADDVTTYLRGFVDGHRTYGDYGDVIVYKKRGLDTATPIIHRAVLYLEVNSDHDSYRCEGLVDLPETKWTVTAGDSWDDITGMITIFDYGYNHDTVTVNVGSILNAFRGSTPSSGFITKGDHNRWIDQTFGDNSAPVETDWIVGKARGEIPWFGLLKLWITDSLESEAPDNSVRNLWIAIAIILIAPITIDVLLTYRIRKKIAKRREIARREYETELQKQEQPDDDSSASVADETDLDAEKPRDIT